LTRPGSSGVKMVDISGKAITYREAKAKGSIRLRRETIEKIMSGAIEKGDVFTTAQIAGILAAKRTHELIPMCHPIPITHASVHLDIVDDKVVVETVVKTTSKTGVEMEALTAATIALLTVWDMVKRYEKDEKGQYPYTSIVEVKVESKLKGEEFEKDSI